MPKLLGVLRKALLRQNGTSKAASRTFLDRFRSVSVKVDHARALGILLRVFRDGDIGPRARTIEKSAMASALFDHHSAWREVFPPLPRCPVPTSTPREMALRGKKDALLRKLIVSTLQELPAGTGPVVNPIADFGMHARALA